MKIMPVITAVSVIVAVTSATALAQTNAGKFKLVVKELSLGKVPAMAVGGKPLVSADNRHVAYAVMHGGKYCVSLDGAEGEPYAKVEGLTFSPDGKLLAADGDGVKLWDVATGQVLSTLPGAMGWPSFSPDGKTLATTEIDTVVLWDVPTWHRRASLKGHKEVVYAKRFSPDGKTLASAGKDGAIILWDVATGRLRRKLAGHPSGWVFSLAFSPDGAGLASAGGGSFGGEAMLWDVSSGQRRSVLPRGAACVTFSPDGKTLASGLLGGGVALWDPTTGQGRTELSGHLKFDSVMAFSPDGKTLASCNSQGSVTLWDTVRGQERAILRKAQHSVQSLAFSPDGRTLATGGTEGEVEFWRAADEREVVMQRPVFDYEIESAGSFSMQGTLLQERGQDEEAENAYFRAVALYERVTAEFPGTSEYRQALAATYRQWFKLVAESSQFVTQDCSRALALADKAIGLAGSEANAFPETVAVWEGKAKLLEKAGQRDKAIEAFTKAIELAGANSDAFGSTLVKARLKLAGGEAERRWKDRTHFFAAAAEAMRWILVDNARRKRCARHGGELMRVDLAAIQVAAPVPDEDEVLAVHEALDELAVLDSRKAELVKLRFFVGLNFAEAAEVLGISEVTAKRDWAFARAWLYRRCRGGEPPRESKPSG